MVLKKLEGHGGGFRDLSKEGIVFEIWRKYIEMTLRENLVEKVSFVFGNGMYGYLVRTKLLEFGLMGTFKGRKEWELGRQESTA